MSEYGRIGNLAPEALAELIRAALPERQHVNQCGLGSCAAHVALDVLEKQAATNDGEDATPAKGKGF